MNASKFFRFRSSYLKVLKFIFVIFILYNIFYFTTSVSEYNLKMELKRTNLTMERLQNKLANIMEHGMKMKDEFMHGIAISNDKGNTIVLPESGIELHDGITDEIRRFRRELNLTDNPGHLGRAVIPDPKLLTAEHKKLMKEGYDGFGSNVFVSNMISLNRQVSDNRSEYCKQQVYRKDLPKVSVVIAFYNEPRSVLMRLVHSILINTPEHLLEEIVLSDDYSDKEELQRPLEDYLLTLKKVKLVRSHARLGVVGARVLGFKNARGPVMVSLDSHMEVAVGWLEPMLDRLKDNPTLVTMSVIKYMDKDDFHVEYDNSWGALGGFDFGMNFNWVNTDTYEPKLSPYVPHKSPTLFGPCFAMWDKFLRHIDYIDVDFDIWGGDDIDLSFKIWMCGGSIELIPCAVAIHLWRDHKYDHSSKGKGGYQWNTDRIAETWLDENYHKYYVRLYGDPKNRKYGDISARLALKEKLGCKSFTWYVENVHPKVEIPSKLRDEVWLTTTKPVQSEVKKIEEKKEEKVNVEQNKVENEVKKEVEQKKEEEDKNKN